MKKERHYVSGLKLFTREETLKGLRRMRSNVSSNRIGVGLIAGSKRALHMR